MTIRGIAARVERNIHVDFHTFWPGMGGGARERRGLDTGSNACERGVMDDTHGVAPAPVLRYCGRDFSEADVAAILGDPARPSLPDARDGFTRRVRGHGLAQGRRRPQGGVLPGRHAPDGDRRPDHAAAGRPADSGLQVIPWQPSPQVPPVGSPSPTAFGSNAEPASHRYAATTTRHGVCRRRSPWRPVCPSGLRTWATVPRHRGPPLRAPACRAPPAPTHAGERRPGLAPRARHSRHRAGLPLQRFAAVVGFRAGATAARAQRTLITLRCRRGASRLR